MTKQISTYFYGIKGGANERKCRRIFDSFRKSKWVSTEADTDGVACVTYNVPDESVESLLNLLGATGFVMNRPSGKPAT